MWIQLVNKGSASFGSGYPMFHSSTWAYSRKDFGPVSVSRMERKQVSHREDLVYGEGYIWAVTKIDGMLLPTCFGQLILF